MSTYTQTATGNSISSSAVLTLVWSYSITSTNTQTTVKWNSVKLTATKGAWFIGRPQLNVAGTAVWSESDYGGLELYEGKSQTITINYKATYNRGTSEQNIAVRYLHYGYKTASADTSFKVPPLPTYKATYYANGGSGAAQTQTYQHTKSMTTKGAGTFTRVNFTQTKWNTQGTGKGTNYALSTSYTPNANLSLYAIWTRVYNTPVLYISQAYRCTSDGTQDDFGACARAVGTFNIWKTSATNTVSSLTASVNGHSASQSSFTYSDSGDWRTGTFDIIIADAALDEETAYVLNVTLTDAKGGASGYSTGTVTRSADIPTAFYTMDILAGGRGVTFGGVARTQDLFEVDWDMLLNGDLQIGGTNPLMIHQAANLMASLGFKVSGTDTPFVRLWGAEDSAGNAVGFGGGGLSILGSGEAVQSMKQIAEKAGWDNGTEHLMIGSDNSEIYFYPYLQAYSASETVTRYRFALTSGPNLRIDQSIDGGTTWSTVTYFIRENGLAGRFSFTSHAIQSAVSMEAHGYKSGTPTITKAGYYPLGVVGTHTGTRYTPVTRAYLSNQTTGSAVLNWMVTNVDTAAHNSTNTIYVLWVNAS